MKTRLVATAARGSSVSRPEQRSRGRSAPGTAASPWEFLDGVRLHAIGGEQVLLCRVQYAPGKQVPWHSTTTPSR